MKGSRQNLKRGGRECRRRSSINRGRRNPKPTMVLIVFAIAL